MSFEELAADRGFHNFHAIIPMLRQSIVKLSDISAMLENGDLDYFYKEPTYAVVKLIPSSDGTREITLTQLHAVLERLRVLDAKAFTQVETKNAIWDYATEQGRKAVLHPMRFALSGRERSADPFIISEVHESLFYMVQ